MASSTSTVAAAASFQVSARRLARQPSTTSSRTDTSFIGLQFGLLLPCREGGSGASAVAQANVYSCRNCRSHIRIYRFLQFCACDIFSDYVTILPLPLFKQWLMRPRMCCSLIMWLESISVAFSKIQRETVVHHSFKLL